MSQESEISLRLRGELVPHPKSFEVLDRYLSSGLDARIVDSDETVALIRVEGASYAPDIDEFEMPVVNGD